jgi:predicted N-acetyltransferase YhbS
MSSENVFTRPELPSDGAALEALHRLAFGPGAYARAAFRVREQAPHDVALSFVRLRDDELIASVRLTPIRIGEHAGHLLGPLVVDPCCKGRGHGKALLALAVEEARKARSPFIVLVGDEPYYGPFGFRPLPTGSVLMPGPVDSARLLVAELETGAAAGLAGIVRGSA